MVDNRFFKVITEDVITIQKVSPTGWLELA